MQVDSAPPFTSVAQQMGQAPAPPPKPAEHEDKPVKASTPHEVGKSVDVSV